MLLAAAGGGGAEQQVLGRAQRAGKTIHIGGYCQTSKGIRGTEGNLVSLSDVYWAFAADSACASNEEQKAPDVKTGGVVPETEMAKTARLVQGGEGGGPK